MRIARHWALMLLALATTAFSSGCAHAPLRDATRWSHSGQLVLVTIDGWDVTRGTLQRFARDDGHDWQPVGAARPVVIGRTGAAWGLGLNDRPAGGPDKREGDGRSPAGVFPVGDAFGYAPTTRTGLRYDAMDAGDYCIDSSDSPLYNRIVDTADAGAGIVQQSTEPMRRDLHADGDQRYRLGFVIGHNVQATPQGGSCIFGHLWSSPDSATTGCTAMAPETMQDLLGWLDARRRPIFVLLPRAEYRRLWQAWALPRPAE